MDTILSPSTVIQDKAKEISKELYDEESQVILHCSFSSSETFDSFIRIWPSTFLFDNHSSHVCDLVHVEKICLFPKWMLVKAGSSHGFSLVFTGLPKSCTSFDMVEKIPQSGGFIARNITRNKQDVYFVNF